MDYLIEVLTQSVEKHGEKPLTNKWLLNIVKLAQDRKYEEANRRDQLFTTFHPDIN